MTVQQFVESTLRLIGVLDAGETPSTNESNHAFDVLNQLLDSWSAAGVPIPSLTLTPISMTGAASYTVTPRPMQIRGVQSVSSGVAQDVTPASAAEWASFRDQTLTGKFATRYYYDADLTTPTIRLWPIPVTGGTLNLFTLQPLTRFTNLSATVSLPPGYEHALRFAFALALAPEYGSVLSPEVAQNAAEAKAAIGSLNTIMLGQPKPVEPVPAAAG